MRSLLPSSAERYGSSCAGEEHGEGEAAAGAAATAVGMLVLRSSGSREVSSCAACACDGEDVAGESAVAGRGREDRMASSPAALASATCGTAVARLRRDERAYMGELQRLRDHTCYFVKKKDSPPGVLERGQEEAGAINARPEVERNYVSSGVCLCSPQDEGSERLLVLF